MSKLNIIEYPAEHSKQQIVRRILGTLPLVARAYARVRFQIIPIEFLDSIEQYLPDEGYTMDLGCGFGLFTLYFAMRRPRDRFLGVDLSRGRIEQARAAARALGVTNVHFEASDAATVEIPGHLNAIYLVDLLHHVPTAVGDRLIGTFYERLDPGGRLIIKEITTHPRYKVYYTFLLDCLVAPQDQYYYRNAAIWHDLLEKTGFDAIQSYPLKNMLPYPHFLMIGRKPEAGCVSAPRESLSCSDIPRITTEPDT